MPDALAPFARRALVAAAAAALVVVLLLFLNEVASVVLVVFVAVLFAVLLDGLASGLAARTRLGHAPALALVVLGLVAVLVGLAAFVGPSVAGHVSTLQEELPQTLRRARENLGALPGGDWLYARVSAGARGAGEGQLLGVFSTAFGALMNVLLIVFVALYLAASPHLYRQGVLHLVPPSRRERAREILGQLGHALRRWLAGTFAAMAVVGVLMTLGLWIIGYPLAPTLGLLAALLAFVPVVGAIAGYVPVVVVGLAEGAGMAAQGLGVALLVQLLESNVITPMIQERVVSLPAALMLAAQAVMGVLAGLLGVFAAAPLTVVAVVLVQMLYVQDVLGDEVEVLGGAPPG